MRKRKDAPGLLRLMKNDAGPRPRLIAPVIQAVVAVPQVSKPRRPRTPVPEQGALL